MDDIRLVCEKEKPPVEGRLPKAVTCGAGGALRRGG